MNNVFELKNKTINGLFWSFLQKISTQIVSFVISVILARLLTPDDYGVVALAGMFTVLLGIFCDGGLGQALVQKKDADEKDFNTMFVTQLLFSFVVYFIVYLSSPYFAILFNNELLTSIIRVSALVMPLGALAGVQNAVVTRRMMFKWYFYASIISLVVSASIGLYLAYNGYGVWALVFQSMSSVVVSTVVIFFLLDWHPRFQFSYARFNSLFVEGLKFLGTNLMGTFFGQLKGYALGWKYTGADLAYYNRGEGVPNLLCTNIDTTIQTVLFPAIAQIQDDKVAVRNAISRSVRISTFILMPMLFGLAAVSDKLVIILYTAKWAQCIPYMQVLCFCLAIGIMCNVNLQALKATGHIGLVLKLEFIKKPIMLLIIIGCMMISPLAIVYGMLVFNIFVFFVNSYPNKKIIKYSYIDQLKDVCPNIIMSILMALLVYAIGRMDVNIYCLIILQILVGSIFYLSISYLLKNESLFYIVGYIRNRR